jgi:hypothetical protein
MDAQRRSAVVLDIGMFMVMVGEGGGQLFVLRVGLGIVPTDCFFMSENGIVIV